MPEDSTSSCSTSSARLSRAHDLVATSDEFLHASWAAAAGGGQASIDLGAASYKSLAEVRRISLEQDKPWWSVSCCSASTSTPCAAVPRAGPATSLGEVVAVDLSVADLVESGAVESRTVLLRAVDAYRGDIEHAIKDIRWSSPAIAPGSSWSTRATAPPSAWPRCSRSTTSRSASSSRSRPSPSRASCTSPPPARPRLRRRAPGLAVLTGDDLSGQRASTKDMRRMPARRKRQIDPLVQARRLRRARAARLAATWRWPSAPCRARPASTWSWSTAPPSAATRRTGSTSSPTTSTRAPACRRRAAVPGPARRRRLDEAGRTGACKAVRQIAGEIGSPVRRPPGHEGHASGLTPRGSEPRGRLPVRRGDPRPAFHRRRGQARHGAAGPDGPPGLRRRRLRQDRDQRARGVQGGPGR